MKPEYTFGIHAVSALLENKPYRIQAVWVQTQSQNPRIKKIIDMATHHNIPIHEVAKHRLDNLVDGHKHQNIIAEMRDESTAPAPSLKTLLTHQAKPLLLILDGIQDPHNLGACLRTANAFGVTAVLAPKERSAPLNAVVRKVAAGSAEYTPLLNVTNLARTIRELKEQGIWVVGTDVNATQTLHEVDYNMPIALVMGSETKGLRHLTKEHCDYLVRIPMFGEIQSLNVSVATGVCLYEIQRQRQLA